MRFSYRIIREKSGFVAECVESEAAGEGPTEAAAVSSLRDVLEERMFRPDAVAPPSRPTESPIELVLADDHTANSTNTDDHPKEQKVLDLGGPGEAAPPPSH